MNSFGLLQTVAYIIPVSNLVIDRAIERASISSVFYLAHLSDVDD